MEGRCQTQKGNWNVLSVPLFLPQLSLHSVLTKHRMLGWLLYKMKKCLSVAAISLQKAEVGAVRFGSSFRMILRYILFFLPALNFGVLRTQCWIRICECEVQNECREVTVGTCTSGLISGAPFWRPDPTRPRIGAPQWRWMSELWREKTYYPQG